MKMRAGKTGVLWVLVLAFSLGPAYAADNAPTVEAWVEDENGPRELMGHFFLPSALLYTPFSISEVSARTNFAYASYEPSAAVRNASFMLPAKLQLAFLQPRFHMQFALPAGFTFGTTLESTVLSGVDTDAAFAFGAAVVISGAGALDWTFFKNDVVALALGTHVAYDTNMNLSPRGALEKSLATQSLDITNLYNSVANTVVTPRFALAIGAGRALGFLGTLEYRVNINQDQGSSSTTENFQVGFGASLDLQPNLGIPFGTFFGYRHSAASSALASEVNGLETSLYFTGKEDVRVGFSGNFEFEQTVDGSALNIYGVLADLTVYF